MNFKSSQKGFTILEAMVALFITTVGVIGVLNVIQQVIFFNETLSKKITGTYLAQEGLEIVKNIRDGNWLQEGVPWDDGFGAGNYQVDYNDLALSNYTGETLKLDSFYHYGGSSPSTFYKRKIVFSEPTGNSLKVTVTVEWNDGQVSISSYIYNWIGDPDT